MTRRFGHSNQKADGPSRGHEEIAAAAHAHKIGQTA
jgi:hypothetical protein